MIDPMLPAVILGLSPTGLAAVRSLGRRGVPVAALTSDRRQHGRFSRYCEAGLCPDPALDPPACAQFLVHHATRWRGLRPVLIPTQDNFVALISEFREQLNDRYRFNLPPSSVLAQILDKYAQYRAALSLGLPVPPTFCPRSPEEVAALAPRLCYPAFIKARYAHKWKGRLPGKGLKVSGPDELRLGYNEVFAAGVEALVQTVIRGAANQLYSACLYAASGDGEILARFAMRKLRQSPAEFGVGTLVESIDFPEVIDLGVRLCRGLGYTGVAEIEFKRDEQDGTLKLIEINPRLWEQASLATACGVDFPYLVYRDLTGNRPALQTGYAVGLRWHDLFGDFYLCARQPGGLGLPAWLKSWMPARAFSVAALDDPKPFLFQAATFFWDAARSVLRRMLRFVLRVGQRTGG